MSFGEGDSPAVYAYAVGDSGEIGLRIKRLREARGPMTQAEFAKPLNVTRGAVGNWERGEGIKRENLVQIANTFKASVQWLSTGQGPMNVTTSNPHEPVNAIVGDKLAETGKYIPLYGQAVAGVDGEFILNGNELDRILAPPSLTPVRGAYAVTVASDSMEPRYYDGETVFIDPTRRVHRGDFVVAQVQLEENGPLLAYVKRFVRHNANELVLSQFNPAKELRFPHKCVVSVHFIVMGGQAT